MESATLTKNNVEVIQQAYADFGSGNVQGILDACTDDVVWTGHDNPTVPIAGTFRGKEEVRQFFANLSREVDYTDFSPREFFSDKDAVIVLGRHAGRVKSTGKTYDHDWCMVFRLREGKIYHFFVFLDTREQAESFSRS